MMYSQQEYDMMRRQTLQVEAEKRAIFKTLLTAVTIILTISLLLLGYLFRRYSQSSTLISAAEARAAQAEGQFQQANQELQDKRAQLESIAQRTTQRNAQINSLIPVVMRKGASDSEVATLAHAIYESPGRVIELPGIPPDSILRRYRYRSGGQVRAYVLVAGNVNGKWLLYSNLVAKADDK
jgi:type II secretory pathway pseudopilin PulG